MCSIVIIKCDMSVCWSVHAYIYVCIRNYGYKCYITGHCDSCAEYGSLQLKDLVRYAVPRVSPKWEEVGLQLDIAPHVLETVEADHRDVEKCCKTMFKKWLHNGEGTGKQPRTWESVLEAVGKAVGSEVCANIEEDIVQGEF